MCAKRMPIAKEVPIRLPQQQHHEDPHRVLLHCFWAAKDPCKLLVPPQTLCFPSLQETKALLERAEDPEVRAALLRFMAAFSACMSPRGLDTDVRHVLVLVLLVGRLDDPDTALRCTAAQLLIGEACCHYSSKFLRSTALCWWFDCLYRPSRWAKENWKATLQGYKVCLRDARLPQSDQQAHMQAQFWWQVSRSEASASS